MVHENGIRFRLDRYVKGFEIQGFEMTRYEKDRRNLKRIVKLT